MRTKSDVLMDYLRKAIDAGETPYQTNRTAFRQLHFDPLDDAAGIDNLRIVSDSLPGFIRALEDLANVARRASTALRG